MTESEWERKGDRDQNKVGGIERTTNKRGGGGGGERQGEEWMMETMSGKHKQIYTPRLQTTARSILQQRWLEWVRVSEQGECVGGGMPQQCSLFRLRFDPCSPDLRGSSPHLLQANSHSVMPNLDSPSLLSHTRVHNDPNDFLEPCKSFALFFFRSGIDSWCTIQHNITKIGPISPLVVNRKHIFTWLYNTELVPKALLYVILVSDPIFVNPLRGLAPFLQWKNQFTNTRISCGN